MPQKHASQSPSPVQVQKFLGGLDYPVAKRDLVKKAKKEGADADTLKFLEQLPDQEYDSPIAVSREFSKLH